jgi:hypothetical protein
VDASAGPVAPAPAAAPSIGEQISDYFLNNSGVIADAVRTAMLNSAPINDVVLGLM